MKPPREVNRTSPYRTLPPSPRTGSRPVPWPGSARPEARRGLPPSRRSPSSPALVVELGEVGREGLRRHVLPRREPRTQVDDRSPARRGVARRGSVIHSRNRDGGITGSAALDVPPSAPASARGVPPARP